MAEMSYCSYEPSSSSSTTKTMKTTANSPLSLTKKRSLSDCSTMVTDLFIVGSDSFESSLKSKTGSSSGDPMSPGPPPPALPEVVLSKCPRYGLSSVCGRRREMEDAVSIRPEFFDCGGGRATKFHFFGVFDGHGCSHVATACRDQMHNLMATELGNGDGALTRHQWEDAMLRSFNRMDLEVSALFGDVSNGGSCRPGSGRCRCELRPPNCNHVGSTAVVAVVGPERIVVTNCGDSRAVLSRAGAAVPLSADHKPDRPDELQRIEGAGGRVIYWEGARALGVLAVSRAIGDNYLKPFVISEPETTVTDRIADDECLILASDGLWDVISNKTACSVVKMCFKKCKAKPSVEGSDKACMVAANLLMKLAIGKGSTDNVSVVVIDLRQGP